MMIPEEKTRLDNQPRIRQVEVVQVIRTRELRGRGNADSVMREVVAYWTMDGVLISEDDPFGGVEIATQGVPKKASPLPDIFGFQSSLPKR